MNKEAFRFIKYTNPRRLAKRLKYELKAPRGKILHSILTFISNISNKKHFSRSNSLANSNVKYVVYDLEVQPATFNVFEFLALSDFYSRTEWQKDFFFVIVQDVSYVDLFGRPSSSGREEQCNRIKSILMPAALMWERCAGVAYCRDRRDFDRIYSELDIFPSDYKSSFLGCYKRENLYKIYRKNQNKFLFHGIRPSSYMENMVQSFFNHIGCRGDMAVTLTIRQTDFDRARNTNLSEWIKFAEYLEVNGYTPIFIPDAMNPFTDVGRFVSCREAAFNLDFRAAIYSMALLNMATPNGPSIVATMNRNSSMIVVNSTPEGSSISTLRSFEEMGIGPNDPYFWYNKKMSNTQLIDTLENLIILFEAAKDNLRNIDRSTLGHKSVDHDLSLIG